MKETGLLDVVAREIPTLLALGADLHRRGRLAEAQAAYEKILTRQPHHFDALHMLGVIAFQTGRHALAVDLIGAAVQVRADVGAAHHHLAQAQAAMRRFDAALASFDRAIALRPAFAEAFNNRSAALYELGRSAEALASADAAIALQPRSAAAFVNRGVALRDLHRVDEALASFAEALALQPNLSDAHLNRAAALREARRFEEALDSCNAALALAPGDARAYVNRGAVLCDLHRGAEALEDFAAAMRLGADNATVHTGRATALLALGRPAEALHSADGAIACDPNHAPAHCTRSAALHDLNRPLEALASADMAIELAPELVDAHSNRAAALHDLDRPDEALSSSVRALRLCSGLITAHTNRGVALQRLNRPEEALESYRQAVAVDPECAEAWWSMALCHLKLGRMDLGWPLYEWRKRLSPPMGVRPLHSVPWTGHESLAGKSLLVFAEQGLGDTLQFSRYVRGLAGNAATGLRSPFSASRVIFAVQAPLRRLLAGLCAGVEVVASEDAIPTDYHCALLTLPLACGRAGVQVCHDIPYVAAEPERVALWRERLRGPGIKIGISWQGSTGRIDLGRSPPLAAFGALASIEGVRLVSLQKGAGIDQLSALPPQMHVETLGDDFDVGPEAFLDSAAVMQSMDLVVTADTAIAHLAGALGRPTWLLLQFAADWRWRMQGASTEWYPSMRLFRQPGPGDWSSVFAEIRRALALGPAAAHTGGQPGGP